MFCDSKILLNRQFARGAIFLIILLFRLEFWTEFWTF